MSDDRIGARASSSPPDGGVADPRVREGRGAGQRDRHHRRERRRFAVANQLPNTVYVVVAGGVLSAVLVPQIVRAGLHADGGRAYINRLLTLALVILVGITLLATLAAPLLAWLYGIKLDQSTRDLATLFAYWCLPQIFFYGLYTLLGEVLNARRSFGPFTWVPVLNNLVAIAGLVVFMAVWGSDPTASAMRAAGTRR